jgi:hypothetical protein
MRVPDAADEAVRDSFVVPGPLDLNANASPQSGGDLRRLSGKQFGRVNDRSGSAALNRAIGKLSFIGNDLLVFANGTKGRQAETYIELASGGFTSVS